MGWIWQLPAELLENLLAQGYKVSFVFIFVFLTGNSKCVHYKILLVTWFKPQTSSIVSDHSAIWATTTAKQNPSLYPIKINREVEKEVGRAQHKMVKFVMQTILPNN